MTWNEFLSHAQSNRDGFYSAYDSDLGTLEPETEGDRWLKIHDKRKPPKEKRNDGYYGPTIGLWHVGVSDGMTVMQLRQFRVKPKPKRRFEPKRFGPKFKNPTLRVVPRPVFSRKLSAEHVAKLAEAQKNRAHRRKHGTNESCQCRKCRNGNVTEPIHGVEFV